MRAAIDQKAMTHELSSKALLDAQSFGGDLLNRSVGDRRDEGFVKAAFQGSTSLLVTGRSVMAKQATSSNGSSSQRTELCWLAPEDLQEYGIEAQTDGQTTVAGTIANQLCKQKPEICMNSRVRESLYRSQNYFLLGCRPGSRCFSPISVGPYCKRDMVICHRRFCIWQARAPA